MRQVAALLHTHPNPVERARITEQDRQLLDLGTATVDAIHASSPPRERPGFRTSTRPVRRPR